MPVKARAKGAKGALMAALSLATEVSVRQYFGGNECSRFIAEDALSLRKYHSRCQMVKLCVVMGAVHADIRSDTTYSRKTVPRIWPIMTSR